MTALAVSNAIREFRRPVYRRETESHTLVYLTEHHNTGKLRFRVVGNSGMKEEYAYRGVRPTVSALHSRLAVRMLPPFWVWTS